MIRQNAAQILAKFLWNPKVKKILKVEFTKDGKYEITTDSQLEFLNKFQDFLEHEKQYKASKVSDNEQPKEFCSQCATKLGALKHGSQLCPHCGHYEWAKNS